MTDHQKNHQLGYFIHSNIQHLPPVIQLYPILKGLVITTNPEVAQWIHNKYASLNIAVVLCKDIKEARALARKQKLKVIVYTSFHQLYCGKSVQIFHGGLSDKRYLESARLITYDLVLFPGQKSVDKVVLAGTLPWLNEWHLVGYPKFDNYINGKLLPALKFSNQRKTILYAPTWVSEATSMRIGDRSAHGESSLLTWSLEIIRQLSSEYNIILKFHSNLLEDKLDIYKRIDKLINELNCEENVKRVFDDNIVPYMLSADLMISDISSVCYEWLHFNKPIVFANPAPGKYQVGNKITDNTYVWQAGSVINDAFEIQKLIAHELEHDSKGDIRTRLFEYAIYQPDGKATERQAYLIESLLAKQQVKNWQLFYLVNFISQKFDRFLASLFRFTKNIPR